jgi:adenosine deaminase
MGWYGTLSRGTYYESMPKVDLHRHLEGSLRLETLLEVSRNYGITLPIEPGLRGLVQIQEGDPLTFTNFLAKFQTLRLFYRSPEIISRITREAIQDAAEDKVRYLEMRFTPVALSRVKGFSLKDVVEWVTSAVMEASQQYDIQTRLLVSMNRHEPVELAAEVVSLAVEYQQKGIAGIDLAGNEAEFSAGPFIGLFREARQAGLYLTVHAGEWGGAENVRQAIEDLEAQRIGHGVRVLEDPYVTALAAERNIPFEVCLTSNVQSGVVPTMSAHPFIRMIKAGINASVHSDDPGISQITLSDEYCLACQNLGLPRLTLAERVLAAANAAFLPDEERNQLMQRLKIELDILEGV